MCTVRTFILCDTLFAVVFLLKQLDFFIHHGAVLVAMRPMEIDDRKVADKFSKYTPPE